LVPQQKVAFPIPNPAFCSVSKGQRRLGEKENRARSVTPGVALRVRTQAGCQWRAIAKDLPPRSTLYDYFDLWGRDGTLDRIHDALYAQCRQAAS
jgi:transposase